MKKIVLFLLFASPIMAQDFQPLYPAGIPNSKPVVNKQKATKGADGIERISDVTRCGNGLIYLSLELHGN